MLKGINKKRIDLREILDALSSRFGGWSEKQLVE